MYIVNTENIPGKNYEALGLVTGCCKIGRAHV